MSQPEKITISLLEARNLALDALRGMGYTDQDASIIADHILDSELRLHSSAGLARIVSIHDKIGLTHQPRRNIQVTRESDVSAQLAGHDTLGYLVAHEATLMAIRKAKDKGVAVVGASGTWYTGMLSYYAEMAASEDLFCLISAHTAPWVALEGGFQPIVGTNPICIGCPSTKGPVIWDIGTSKIINAQVRLAKRLQQPLPEHTAFDKTGHPTRDPDEALQGAFAGWGGAKGSGLAIMIQMMGALAGAKAIPPPFNSGQADGEDNGHLIMAIDPQLFQPYGAFLDQVDAFAESVRNAKPVDGHDAPRMPFDRSRECRRDAFARGTLEVDSTVVDLLQRISSSRISPKLS